MTTIVEQAPINFVGYFSNYQTAIRLNVAQTSLFGSKVFTLKMIGTPYEYYNPAIIAELMGREVEFSHEGMDVDGKVINPQFIALLP